MPSSVSLLAYIPSIGLPSGVQINWNGEIINLTWGQYVKSKADTEKTEPYGLHYGECYGEPNTECPGTTGEVNYRLQGTIKYIWS